MLNLTLNKNFNTIMTSFLSYLPSRLLVVLNALIIVPIFAHLMSEKEIGIFQLAIGVLNLVCTCSTDWIAKSALRFYEKYCSCNKLDEFFSNIIWLTLFVYILVFLCFLFFADFITEKFFISKSVLLLTFFIVIPTGIRQFLYQILRVLNRPFLYSFSIIIYQMSLLSLYLVFTGFMPNVFAVLSAMAIAMLIIDIFMLKQVNLRINSLCGLHFDMLVESLKYALPQIVTNFSIWIIFNINKYVFQYNQYFSDTAATGVAWLLTTSILTPVLSTFSFAVFPFIVKKYENRNKIRPYMTTSIRLYCTVFIPVIGLFCYYSKIIAALAFKGKYGESFILLSFFAVCLFLHELIKLFNIKYHLKNKTYIEMAVGMFVGLICLNLNIAFINKFHLVGAGVAMLISMLLLFTLNLAVQFKSMNYINYFAVIKTVMFAILFTAVSYLFVELLFMPLSFIYNDIVKLIFYIFICYVLSAVFVRKLLV